MDVLAFNRVPLHEILGEKHRDNQGEVVCGYHDKQGMA
jgi:hypothetical protein